LLLPRVGRDNEQHAIECERMTRFDCSRKMRDVDGIERAAEDAETSQSGHGGRVYG
jgi:hypothetical protein